MPRILRVISINFPMSASSVVNEPSLKTTRALFDFDVVVIRPYILSRTSEGRDTGNDRAAAEREMRVKKPDLNRVLEQGGLIVVILDKVDIIKFNSGQYSYPAERFTRPRITIFSTTAFTNPSRMVTEPDLF